MQLPMNPQRQQQQTMGPPGPARPTAVLRASPGSAASAPNATPAQAHSSRAVQQTQHAWYQQQQAAPQMPSTQTIRQGWQPQLTTVPSSDCQTPMSTITEPPQMADQAAGLGAEPFKLGWDARGVGLTGSVASTTTLLMDHRGMVNERGGSFSVEEDTKLLKLESRVDEATSLASQVSEALQQFTQRVNDVLAELRAELPQIRQESVTGMVELQKSTDTMQGALSLHIHRIEALEQELGEEKEARRAAGNEQAQSLDDLKISFADECEARSDMEKQLSKHFHDQLSSEVDSVRDMMMREMRERMDGQKVLREEMQIQQQALMRSTHCLDEALIELRTEVPRLGQELVAQKGLSDKLTESHSSTSGRLEDLEAKSMQQFGDLRESARFAIKEQEERLDQKAVALAAEIADLRGRLDEHRTRADATNADVRAAREAAEALAREAADRRKAFDGLSSQLRASQDQNDKQASDFDSKVSTLEADLRTTTQLGLTDMEQSLRGWVEMQAMKRISSLEQALRKEMTDRTATTQQVLDKISKNAERWCTMQDKFDEIMVAMHRIPSDSGNTYPSR